MKSSTPGRTFVVAMVCMLLMSSMANASGKIGIYGISMVPYGQDAEKYTRPSWGGGVHGVFPLPVVSQIFAIVGGFEYVNLLSKTLHFREPITSLRIEQTTDQSFMRFFVGGQLGGHGSGFLRPHAGVTLALVYYEFRIDNVIPNDADPEHPLSQNLLRVDRAVFGYDFTLGLDLNFSNTIALDGGVKYVKSFSVPQQLGRGSVKIYPQYFQIYFGIGVSLDLFMDG